MKMRCGHPLKSIFLLGLFLCLIALPAQAEKVFNAESFTLENGMQVVVIPNKRAPVATHMVWYKVGAADEPKGKSGIAHFMEHLMFKGSEGLEPGEFSDIVRGLGGNDNAFTSQDFTAYFQSIASEHLETVMRMEAGRMRGMTLPPEEIESERKVILEERRQRTDNNPEGQFREKVLSTLYGKHPYGNPTIGWIHEMEVLSREDAKTFYDRWYMPNNAILVISGDVNGRQVLDLANKIYGPIPAGILPERKRPETTKTGNDVVRMNHPAVRQPTVQKVFLVPSYRENPEDSLALEVLQEIAGNGATSRLYKSLVINQKLASGAGLYFRGEAWDKATLWAYATPLPGIEPEKLAAAVDTELQKIATEGIRQDELVDAISRMQNEAIYARDSLQGPAMIFGQALSTGANIDDVEYWPDNIAKVTAEQIQEVVKKYLVPDNPEQTRSVTGFLLPEEKKQEEQPE